MKYEESHSPTLPSAEVQEPATAYCTAGIGIGSAISAWEAEENDEDYDYGAPESVTVRTYAELCRKLEDGLADIEAGRVYPWEEVRRELRRKYFNESI
jgi:hypothetical protein